MHNVLCKRPRLKTLALIFMGLIAFVATLGFSNVHTTHAASVWINSGAADLATSSKWKNASGTSITEDGWWRKRDGSANGTVLFCVQLGAPLNNNLNTGFTATTVTDAQHKHISEIAYYGYYAQGHTYTNEMFTQWAIWQYLGDTYVSSPLTSQYNAWKANVNAKVAAYDKAPSFNNTTVNIDAGTTKALNDTNSTLGTYASTATSTPAGLKASISGNTLNITAANNAVVSGGAIKFADNIAATYEGAALLYSRPGFQSVILPKIDPTFKKFTVNVNVIHYGTVKLTKQDAETGTAQNGATFAGATFKLTDTKTGATETLTTDASGTAVSGKHAIGDGYSIVETKAPAGYKLNTTPVTGTFTHVSGDTTYSAASVQTAATIKDSYIYHARIKVNKQDSLTGTKPENGNTFAGAVFKLTDTTTGVSETLTTDSNGIAVSSDNFAVGDAYSLVEMTAPKGYQLNSAVVSGTFTLTKEDGYANTNALTVKDKVIPDQISIHKTDEKGKDLAGIKFKISDTKADLTSGKFLKLAADGKTVVFPNQAVYSDSLQDYVATTDAKGIATWSNIVKPASKTDRTYYFDEISTDKDHQLLTKGSAISAGDTGANNTYTVVNQSKIKLPNTGSQDAAKLAVVLIVAVLGASAVGVSLVINKKKGNNYMNQVKKVKHLRLAFTVCGVALALGAGSAFVINATNSSTVHAAEVQLDANSDFARLAPTTVNYTVHKGMTLLGKTQASVVDDGNAQSWNNDTTDFDPAQYGKVGYTAYDITNTIESGDMTDAGLKSIGDDIAKDPTENYYIKNAQTKTAEQFITTGSTTTFKNLAASDDNSEHHVWAIIETTHPKGLVTQISQPIIVALPLTNTAGTAWQTESNGYPKNIVQQLKFTLTKHGDSPSGDGKTSYLPGIPFQLYTGKPGSGTATGTVVKTDANGALTVSGLVRGDYYFVEESSSDVADIDSDSDATYLLGANARNDSANKLTFSVGEDGVDPNTLHADVMNYHAPDMQKTLEDDHNSFTEGTLADFKTAIHIPNDIDGGTGSEIAGQSYITEPYGVFEGTDTADTGLTWNRAEANFKATIDINSNGKVDDGDVTLKEGTDYTLTDLADGRGYKIQFIVNNGKVSDTVAKYQGGEINLTYSEVINNDAVIDSALYNTFDLGYQNHPLNVGKQHTRHIKHKVPVYTYGARFTKQSSGLFGTGIARTPLEGAQFVVQNADGKFFNGFKDGADDDAIVEAQWVDKAADVTAGILTSDKDGNFAIKGLIAGNYVLQEVKAPTGYELNNHSQKFVVGPKTYTNTVYVASDDAKPTLPNTGSNEFKAMIAISIVVIAGVAAVSVYEVKKHKVA